MEQISRAAVESARNGGTALDHLIAAVWPEAYRIAYGVLRDRGLAEDAAQEACASMARSLPKLKEAGAFHSWFYRIVVNRAMSTARRLPRTRQLETMPDAGFYIDRSDALDLFNALAALSPRQRALILLHYYAGLTSGEIAAAIGSPASTIRFQLMLARSALRKVLTQVQAQSTQADEEAFTNVR